MRRDAKARQQRAIELAASGHTPAEIAAAVGCSLRTVRELLASEEAQALVAQVRHERLAALASRSLDDAGDALATLRAIMRDPACPPTARVRAAATILEGSLALWRVGAPPPASLDVGEALAALLARAAEARVDHQTDHLRPPN